MILINRRWGFWNLTLRFGFLLSKREFVGFPNTSVFWGGWGGGIPRVLKKWAVNLWKFKSRYLILPPPPPHPSHIGCTFSLRNRGPVRGGIFNETQDVGAGHSKKWVLPKYGVYVMSRFVVEREIGGGDNFSTQFQTLIW